MILVGQYDSPFTRRVGISLRVLGFAYQHDTRSVFGDFDAMRTVNPLGRIPALILDDGATLIDSAAILDFLDEQVGPARALTPRAGPARRDALQTLALACGAVEKFGAVNYERLIRPSALRWPDWIDRCIIQARGALAALERRDWRAGAALDQAAITTVCLIGYLRLTLPEELDPDSFPKLIALAQACEGMAEFRETDPGPAYAVPRAE
jgi:glutathione S-transferase